MSDPATDVVWMLRGGWVSMVLRAGVRLGVFDELTRTRTVTDLAAALDADVGALDRLLAAMTTLGLVERDGDGVRSTERGALLADSHPGRIRDLVLMQSESVNLLAWADLDRAVRTGAGVFEGATGRSYWEHLRARPDLESTFNAAMARRAGDQVATLLDAGAIVGHEHVVDVGGGRGGMLAGLLEARPGLTGVVADRPSVAAEATSHLAELGYGERAHGVGCDFRGSVPPGGDVYALANVLHDWDDAGCADILRSIRAAAGPDTRLLVVERVLDAPGRTDEGIRELRLLDLHMLVVFGGRERTQAEYDDLLLAAGFTRSRMAVSGDWNVLEARLAVPDLAAG